METLASKVSMFKKQATELTIKHERETGLQNEVNQLKQQVNHL